MWTNVQYLYLKYFLLFAFFEKESTRTFFAKKSTRMRNFHFLRTCFNYITKSTVHFMTEENKNSVKCQINVHIIAKVQVSRKNCSLYLLSNNVVILNITKISIELFVLSMVKVYHSLDFRCFLNRP